MSNTVKGIVESFTDDGGSKGKYSWQHRISVTVDGERYSGFMSKSAEALGIDEGRLVTFVFTEKGEYKNIDPKSLKVSTPAENQAAPPRAEAPAAASGARSSGLAGVVVGHAINNAVQLAIATGDVSLQAIHGYAVGILALSVKLGGQYEKVVAAADNLIAKAAQSGPIATVSAAQPAAHVPASTPASVATQAQAPAKAKPGPKPKPASAPVKQPPPESFGLNDPEPEPIVEEVAQPEKSGEPDFDDDIPF